MRQRLIALLLFASLLFVSNAPALSYTLRYTDPSASVQIKWPLNNSVTPPTAQITIAFSTSLNSPPSNIKAGSDVVGAAHRALQHWAEAANIQFTETTSSAQSVSASGSGGDGISLITVANTPENAALFDQTRTGRTITFFNPANGAISEADITVNPNLQFSTDGTQGTYDLESVFAHEIGHLLGLDHTGVLGATMMARQGTNGIYGLSALTPRTLSEDDKAGVRALYGPRGGTGSIAGTVRNAAGGAAFGAHVWVEHASNGRVMASNISLSNGTYRIDALPPGSYRVMVEYLDGPIFTSDVASTSGAYAGITSTPPFRTYELPGTVTVGPNSTTPLDLALPSGSAPALNPSTLGINGQISSIAVPLTAPTGGNTTYTIYVGGTGVDQISSTGVSVTSPNITVDQSSVSHINASQGIPPIITFNISVRAGTPIGEYSIRLQSSSGEVAYIAGGLTVDISSPTSPATNPIDDAQFFVAQHYRDFLNREPDAGGLAYWTDQITQCGKDPLCTQSRRIGVSAAYFIETEFQQTGFYVYRVRKAALGLNPTFAQFQTDRSQIGLGSDTDKVNFTESFVQKPEFTQKYPTTLDASGFVNALIATVQQGSKVDLSSRRADLLNEYSLGTTQVQSRARVLRKLIEYPEFTGVEYNRAFVLMQYFGYLRRDPDQGGYDFWLNVLNTRLPNDASGYRSMVCAFITSAEYQLRFGLIVTHSDTECG